MKSWIVYVTPDNKVDAVEYNKTGLQCDELTKELNVVIGDHLRFKYKVDAIDYAKQRWL